MRSTCQDCFLIAFHSLYNRISSKKNNIIHININIKHSLNMNFIIFAGFNIEKMLLLLRSVFPYHRILNVVCWWFENSVNHNSIRKKMNFDSFFYGNFLFNHKIQWWLTMSTCQWWWFPYGTIFSSSVNRFLKKCN